MDERTISEKWWLITWTTFGTWLPGDPRGFQTWRGRRYVPPPTRYAKPGERPYDPRPFQKEYRTARGSLSQAAVCLSADQCQTVIQTITAEVLKMPLIPAILSVDSVHVHFLSRFGVLIRSAVGRLKFAATKKLHESGFLLRRVWCRGCHMKSIDSSEEVRKAFEYVMRHRDNGALIHIWERPF